MVGRCPPSTAPARGRRRPAHSHPDHVLGFLSPFSRQSSCTLPRVSRPPPAPPPPLSLLPHEGEDMDTEPQLPRRGQGSACVEHGDAGVPRLLRVPCWATASCQALDDRQGGGLWKSLLREALFPSSSGHQGVANHRGPRGENSSAPFQTPQGPPPSLQGGLPTATRTLVKAEVDLGPGNRGFLLLGVYASRVNPSGFLYLQASQLPLDLSPESWLCRGRDLKSTGQ